MGELRSGIYNPNLFVGDLYGSFFAEAKMNQHDVIISMMGAAFVFEVGLASNYLMTPSIGITLEGEEVLPFLQFSLQF